jgi:ribosome maturation factor RimP
VKLPDLPRKKKLAIFVDGDQGVTIEQCARISRRVGHAIEEGELLASAYTLEVSSPGADLPLKLFRQYGKHIGRTLEISTVSGAVFQASLLALEGEMLQLEKKSKNKKEKPEALQMPFAEVASAKVLISF